MTDEQILALYWARAENAIEETDKAYGRYVRYIASNILRDEQDASEVVNDTYYKAWNTIPPEWPNPLKTFLGRIARQLSINRLKANNSQKRGGGQYFLALDEMAECIPSGGSDFTEVADLRAALNAFLRCLPAEYRMVFVRRYWHLCSISEIAQQFSMSESKVKSLLMRTREKLKKCLTEEGFII